MRRNKTYSQQKKFYDSSDNYQFLADLFVYWYDCGRFANKKQIIETYKECNKQCRTQIVDELLELLDTDYSQEARTLILWFVAA